MPRENPAGTKLIRQCTKAKKRGGFGDGLRRMFTAKNRARLANGKRRRHA